MWIFANLVDATDVESVAVLVPSNTSPAPAAPDNPPTNTPVPPMVAPPVAGSAVQIVNLNKSDEYVVIENKGTDAIALAGWVLVSEKGNQRYSFPNGFILSPGASVTVWAIKLGANNATNLYSGFSSNIWNNSDRDDAVLLDSTGAEVSRHP